MKRMAVLVALATLGCGGFMLGKTDCTVPCQGGPEGCQLQGEQCWERGEKKAAKQMFEAACAEEASTCYATGEFFGGRMRTTAQREYFKRGCKGGHQPSCKRAGIKNRPVRPRPGPRLGWPH